jgi:hypothetical protein
MVVQVYKIVVPVQLRYAKSAAVTESFMVEICRQRASLPSGGILHRQKQLLRLK